ncbi:MAG: hypothetical protein NZ898_01870 [Myxococcota bacterium]|nr:hypothetical protein [Myxococcota bacterium]MDW8363063.1 hypothetical protein [Myxococcales bacterium]
MSVPVLGPDVLVNASVALGSPPERVVNRVLGQHRGESPTTEWILERMGAMLRRVESFRAEAVEQQVALVRSLTRVVADDRKLGPDAWVDALVSAARAGGVPRVVTDHPDLLERGEVGGIEFVSSEAWLLEQQMPPPPPPAPGARGRGTP